MDLNPCKLFTVHSAIDEDERRVNENPLMSIQLDFT